jgi:hypothetical protein
MFDDTGIVCSPTLSSWICNAGHHEIGETCPAWFDLQILRLDFLVRLTRRHSRHGPWRASRHEVRTGELIQFARSAELWAYLQAEMASEDQPVARGPA